MLRSIVPFSIYIMLACNYPVPFFHICCKLLEYAQGTGGGTMQNPAIIYMAIESRIFDDSFYSLSSATTNY